MRAIIKVDSRMGVGDRSRSALRTRRKGSWPVSRVLWNALRHSGSHSSGPAVTCRLEQPTRGQREPRYCPPIWSCSGWGLPCRFCCQKRGGLLPDSLAAVRIPFGTRTVDLSTVRTPCGTRTVSPSPDPTPFSLRKRDFAALRPQSRVPAIGRLFSVALSIASRRPVVNRHPALRSPDFPLCKRIAQRLPGQLRGVFYALHGPPLAFCVAHGGPQ